MEKNRLHVFRTLSLALFPVVLGTGAALRAQTSSSSVDVAVTYTAQRSLRAGANQTFWLQGGSVELGAGVYKGFGIVADVTGSYTNSIGSSGLPLSLVTATFGPRYRWHGGHKVSLYGEALAGEANGFNSFFPTSAGGQTDANGLALQIGGGVDYQLKKRFALRVLDAAWLRTQLPNSTNNVQNNLRLGAGVVARFGR